MTDRSQFASNLGVAGGTLASRLTGLARLIVFAAVIGQSALADAFDVGNNAPNVIYELLLGGTLTAVLVPLFVAHRERGDRDGTAAVFGTGLIALGIVTAVAVVAAPAIFRLYALSPSGDAAAFHAVGSALTRVFLLQIFFYGLNAMAAGVLNANGRFLAAAWAPVASNLVAIGALLGMRNDPSIAEFTLDAARSDSRLFWWFSLGPTLGIAAMAVVVMFVAIGAGVLPRPVFSPRHPAVRDLFRVSGWAIGYIAANQVALVVVKNLADPGSGRLDAYAKAMTIFQLPHGLLAVTVVTTTAPLLARAAAHGEFVRRFVVGARTTVALTLLPAIAMLTFAEPIVRLLLGWGAFDTGAVTTTARALGGMGIGLVGFSLYLFALRGFYSHGDTRTPFLINIGQNLLNIALAIALAGRYDVLGLGLAFAISYLVFAVVAVGAMARTHGTPCITKLLFSRR
ncbi:MAG: murein biosynthesis integral membrane protein MurJ [Ilumatobacteraceae bacterium]